MSFFQPMQSGNMAELKNIISKGAFLVDVREPDEFSLGTAKGAINIPLGSVPAHLDMFQDKENIVVFCRSGNRSGQAKKFLEMNGITNVINGGTWQDVAQLVP